VSSRNRQDETETDCSAKGRSGRCGTRNGEGCFDVMVEAGYRRRWPTSCAARAQADSRSLMVRGRHRAGCERLGVETASSGILSGRAVIRRRRQGADGCAESCAGHQDGQLRQKLVAKRRGRQQQIEALRKEGNAEHPSRRRPKKRDATDEGSSADPQRPPSPLRERETCCEFHGESRHSFTFGECAVTTPTVSASAQRPGGGAAVGATR